MSGPVLLAIRIALAAALYAFAGWALYVLWKELRQQSLALRLPQAPALLLTGTDLKIHRFTRAEISIGRDPTSSCHLEDPTISAQHARLTYHHGHWWVEDLKSTNGTFLNAEAVVEPVVITTGDMLRFGQLIFQVSIGDPSLPEAQSDV